MAHILTYSPGQVVTVYLETRDTDGYLADGYYDGYAIDGYTSPIVKKIILPDMTSLSGYPHVMTKIETGTYYYQFTLPTGATAVGSYLVEIAYREPDTDLIKFSFYQVQVNAPFGLYSATSF